MNWAAFAVTILTGFLMSPFLVRSLGDSVYGVWVLIGSLAGYMGLLDFGITQSTVKYVAEHRARGDQNAINRVVTAGFAVFSVTGFLCLAASLAVASSFNDLFSTPLSRNTAALVVVLAGINLAATFPASVFIGVLRGFQRYDIDALVTSVIIVVRSLLLVALINGGSGILAVSSVTLGFDLLRLGFLVRSAYKLNPELRIGRSYFNWSELGSMFKYSLLAFMIVAGRQVILYTDSIVIGLFLSTSLVTVYFIAARLVSYLRTLVSEMVGVLAPTASELSARQDNVRIRELLIISTKYTLLISLPAAAVFCVLGDRFIELWMGPTYSMSATILIILTVGTIAGLLELPADTVLLGIGRHGQVARFTMLQASVNLLMSILLVRRFGLIGVAVGTTIPMVAFTFVALPLYFRSLGVSLAGYFRRSILLPLTVQTPFLALVIAIKAYLQPASLILFFGEIALAGLPYLFVAWFVCISRTEREAFFRLGKRFGFARGDALKAMPIEAHHENLQAASTTTR